MITLERAKWKPIRFILSSGGWEKDVKEIDNSLIIQFRNWLLTIKLPNLLRPEKVMRPADWDAETIKRLGRNYFYDIYPREYGFCLSDGFLQIFFGSQSQFGPSRRWSKFLPWTQWTYIRHSIYDEEGCLYWSEFSKSNRTYWESYCEYENIKKVSPKKFFLVEDVYNNYNLVRAETTIEEMEWHFGTGGFQWLKYFRKPLIKRTLEIRFLQDVGPGVGTWKGGLVGIGIGLLPGELHEEAFKRYCQQTHNHKGVPYTLKFIGEIGFVNKKLEEAIHKLNRLSINEINADSTRSNPASPRITTES
jgi:hypothetical protein